MSIIDHATPTQQHQPSTSSTLSAVTLPPNTASFPQDAGTPLLFPNTSLDCQYVYIGAPLRKINAL